MLDFSLEFHEKMNFRQFFALIPRKAYVSPYNTRNPTKFTLNSQELFLKKDNIKHTDNWSCTYRLKIALSSHLSAT